MCILSPGRRDWGWASLLLCSAVAVAGRAMWDARPRPTPTLHATGRAGMLLEAFDLDEYLGAGIPPAVGLDVTVVPPVPILPLCCPVTLDWVPVLRDFACVLILWLIKSSFLSMLSLFDLPPVDFFSVFPLPGLGDCVLLAVFLFVFLLVVSEIYPLVSVVIVSSDDEMTIGSAAGLLSSSVSHILPFRLALYSRLFNSLSTLQSVSSCNPVSPDPFAVIGEGFLNAVTPCKIMAC